MINLVGDQAEPPRLAGSDYGLHLRRRQDRASRIGGAGDDHARKRSLDATKSLGGQLVADLRPARDFHRLQVQSAERIPIGDIARTGQGDTISGGEAGRQSQNQSRGRPARQQEPVRREVDAIDFLVVLAQPELQRLALPVAPWIGVEGPVRRGDGRRMLATDPGRSSGVPD